MPDAELWRQREASRRGLLRAAAIDALIIAVISLAFVVIRQRSLSIGMLSIEARRNEKYVLATINGVSPFVSIRVADH